MWQIKNPIIKTATLDFTNSGQPPRQVSQLFSEETLLINAIELIDWDEEKVQLLVCASCGFTHCESGGWVSVRIAGDFILFLPAFAVWLENEDSYTEYHPPAYVLKRGIPYITVADYAVLRSHNSSFPFVAKIRQLNLQEAIRAFQIDTPSRIFGSPPGKVVARKEAILGASVGDGDEHVKFIETFAQTNTDNESSVQLRLPKATETIISLYIDTHEFIEWKVLAGSDCGFLLMLNSEFVIALE
jgi:hypothetical protein